MNLLYVYWFQGRSSIDKNLNYKRSERSLYSILFNFRLAVPDSAVGLVDTILYFKFIKPNNLYRFRQIDDLKRTDCKLY